MKLIAIAFVPALLGCAADRPEPSTAEQSALSRPVLGTQLVDVLKSMLKQAAKDAGADPARVDGATYKIGTTKDFELWAADNCVQLPPYDPSLATDPAPRVVFVRGADLGGKFPDYAAFEGYKPGTIGDFDVFAGGLCDCELTDSCPRGCSCVQCLSGGTSQATCVPLPHASAACTCH